MPTEDIQALARAIADRQLLQLGLPYFLGLLITVLCAAFAAFLGSYFRERGKNYATKQDFDELLEQVQKTTAVTTEIKTQIEHADWRQREYITLRRQKAEELAHCMDQLCRDLEDESKRVFFEGKTEVDHNDGGKCARLVVLYFPELASSGLALGAHTAIIRRVLQEYIFQRNSLEQERASIVPMRNESTAEYLRLSGALLSLCSYIEQEVCNIMAEVSGVRKPYGSTRNPEEHARALWENISKRMDLSSPT